MTKGNHLIIDCYNVSHNICLDDKHFLNSLVHAAEQAGANIISENRYHFGHNSPPGFAITIMLDESHISAHSYADEGMIAMDMFTCGAVSPNKIFEIFLTLIPIQDYKTTYIPRF